MSVSATSPSSATPFVDAATASFVTASAAAFPSAASTVRPQISIRFIKTLLFHSEGKTHHQGAQAPRRKGGVPQGDRLRNHRRSARRQRNAGEELPGPNQLRRGHRDLDYSGPCQQVSLARSNIKQAQAIQRERDGKRTLLRHIAARLNSATSAMPRSIRRLTRLPAVLIATRQLCRAGQILDRAMSSAGGPNRQH